MKKFPLLCIASLVACTPVTDVPPDNEVQPLPIVSSVSSSSSEVSSVQKVTEERTGTIEPAGITIYQQGTHKLVLETGDLLLLESDTVDLNGYVNEYVTVSGVISSTVEANGLIMAVESITLTEQSSSEDSSESSSTSSADVSSDESISSESSVDSTTTSSSESSEDSSEESSDSSVSVTTSSAESVSSSTATTNPTIEALASYDYDASQWTQEYCSNLEPYCLAMHKNWWFRSFGATSKELNRIEISNAEVENIGDGVIVVRLLSGSPADMGGSYGSVTVSGNTAMAFHAWDDGRYFVVQGDVSLQTALQYLANSISRSE